MQPAPRTVPTRTASAEPFIGRKVDSVRVRDFIARSRSGSTGALLIESEAGGGKTRLLREALHGVATTDDMTIWSAGGDATDPRPLRCLTEALDCRRTSAHAERARIAALLGGLHGSGERDGDAPSAAAHELIVDLVEREALQRPVLLVIDDLQWADAASLATLSSLVRRLQGLPVGVLGASRPNRSVQQAFRACDAASMSLTPFNDRELVEFAESVAGVQPSEAELPALRRVHGNPFLLSLALGLSDRSSATVARSPLLALRRMTAALHPSMRAFLEVAAVAGRELDVDLIAQVSGQRVAGAVANARVAVAEGWLSEEAGTVRFRHDLLREGLLESVADDRLAEIHLVLGRTLAGLGHAPTRAAHHLAQAAGLLIAADAPAVLQVVAAHPLDAEPALQLLRRLLHIVGEPGLQITVSEELVRRLAARQHHDEAVVVAVAATAAIRALGPAAEAGFLSASVALRRLAARSLVALEQRHRAREIIEDALADRRLRPGDRAALQATLAELHWFDRATDAVRLHAAAALASAAEADDPGPQIDAHCILSSAASLLGDVDLAIRHAGEAAHLHGGQGGRRASTIGLAMGTALVGAGRFTEGLEILSPSLQQVERDGDVIATVLHLVVMQGSRLHIGEWDGFVADADAMVAFGAESGRRAGIVFPTALGAMVAVRRGDDRSARELMARATAEMTRGDVHPAAPVGLMLLEIARAEMDGRPDRAAAEAIGLVQLLEPVGYTTQLLIALDAARYAWAVEDRPTLAVIAERTRSGAARSGTPTRIAIARYCDALLSGDASGLAAAAMSMAATERRWDTATAFHIAGLAARRAPSADRRSVQALFTQAAAMYRHLGCVSLAAAAESGEGGVARHASPSSGASEPAIHLSGAERRVLSLVTTGRSNAEIAEELFITKRTVESHLSSLYRKLGITTRVALATVGSHGGRDAVSATAG